MDTSALKKFAAKARTDLIAQVGARLDYVLSADTAELREREKDIAKIKSEIVATSQAALIERVAYLWFNRMSALRFMDTNGYTDIGIVSGAPGQTQAEILAEAKSGHIDPAFAGSSGGADILELLTGKSSEADPEAKAYRTLFLNACNHYGTVMPFMFEAIADHTELLLPDDLLSENSVLTQLCEVMTKDACKDVEIIGWLYQFYIAEKKDDVRAGLKKKKKVTPENLPAVTQLFTPHWIVRYLVENSLGRLWMLNNPESNLTAQMDYYIAPVQAETDFLKITSPEELKICDPAAGSGHMLTYAFDLLYSIYQERGYDAAEIPSLILTHNLYGIELDERAGALAGFALMMKAREKHRRFFNSGVQPNICVLENIAFNEDELSEYIDETGRDLFTSDLRETLRQFNEAKNFGSLITPKLTDVTEARRVLDAKDLDGQLFLLETHKRVKLALRMADYLSPKYHIVVANPPYLGGGDLNGRLKAWAKENYADSKSDLFAMFIERGFSLTFNYGYNSMVTMQSWMFLSSYEKLRVKLDEQSSLIAMSHMANMVMGIAFGTSATIWKKCADATLNGAFCYVEYSDIGENGVPVSFPPHNERNAKAKDSGWFHRACADDFKKIPGSPIAYSASPMIRELFETGTLKDIADTRLGMATADNNLFLRLWYEVCSQDVDHYSTSRNMALSGGKRWFPYQKGGNYRKWAGNNDYYVLWENDGEAVRSFADTKTGKIRSHNYNLDFIFRKGITWNALTSSKTSARLSENSLFDNAGSSLFTNDGLPCELIMTFINSEIMQEVFPLISPTLNYQPGDLSKLPVKFGFSNESQLLDNANLLITLSRTDWDAYETSWDFTTLPLLSPDYHAETLADTYDNLRTQWRGMTTEMLRLEEENNRIFIDAYGLDEELTPDVLLSEITLTCNPAYRYKGQNTPAQLEEKLRKDTVQEFLHYAVGCMFGRFSLDEPGLILANAGETLADYLARVPEPSFMPDDDNIIPVLDSNWFEDDIVDRFTAFLRVTFGDENYSENLAFIKESLGGKSVRDWFLKDFYTYHWKRYKKRPIYWMLSSPKGSFNVLFYMHRYRPELFSQVLEDYLRPFQAKLTGHLSDLARIAGDDMSSAAQIKSADKESDKVRAMLIELEDWERDVLYPLAGQRQALDLDNGVKANYPLFAPALKKIPGL